MDQTQFYRMTYSLHRFHKSKTLIEYREVFPSYANAYRTVIIDRIRSILLITTLSVIF